MSDKAVSPLRLSIPQDRLVELCRRWKISELSLFGSALRDDFRPNSDVDLLVTFELGVSWGFDHILDMKEELEKILGRAVDLIERRMIESSENYIRRNHILSHLVPLYVAPSSLAP